jgi:hypothetical protein
VLVRFAGAEPAEIVGGDAPLADAVACYRGVTARVDEVVRGTADLGRRCADPGYADVPLRWVVAHLLEETARHAGHADILREIIDGSTGR